ncbi:MAG: hypothetical protein JWR84_2897 [Caulobacter sp.]|nr:hypothetical protein [Caulobacter sp.]
MPTQKRAPRRPPPPRAGPLERTVRNLVAAGALLFAGWMLWPAFAPDTPRPAAGLVSQAQAAVESSGLKEAVIDFVDPPPPVDQHFAGCDDARAAGRENIPRDDPSYRERMDGDGDGLACEPFVGR